MRVLVVGAGGVGGYFGGRWAQAGLDVTLLARGPHLRAMQQSGLTLRTPDEQVTVGVRAVDDPGAAGEIDLVIFATKTWQLMDAARAVAPCLPAHASAIAVQNGVEAAEQLRRVLPAEAILGGTCRIISYIEEPGVIRRAAVPPTLLVGEPGGGLSERTRHIASTLDLGRELTVTASPLIELDIWKKFLFFAPLSGVGSVTRSPVGVMRSGEESRALLRAAVREVGSVARASGVPLTEDHETATLGFIDGLPEDGTTSLQRDIEAGRPNELEALAGAVSRLGAELGVRTPVHDFILGVLR